MTNRGDRMKIDLNVPAFTVRQSTTYTMKMKCSEEPFPILIIDKGSYIVGSKVQCGISSESENEIYNFQIGRFSSLAEDILFMMDMNHDYLSVYQGIIPTVHGWEEMPLCHRKIKRKGQIIIENDCWIGHGATIMSDVTVHNGAVVGAMAVVTKDVPAYSIVAGNPAKIVGYRFEQNVINALLKIAWWDWPDSKIAENLDLLNGDVKKFIQIAEKEIKIPLAPSINRITNGKLFVYYLDLDQPYPLWNKVIHEFIMKYAETNYELLLVLDTYNPRAPIYGEELLDKLKDYKEIECYINIYSDPIEDDSLLLYQADYYITNRHSANIHRMCVAEQAGAKCISAFNTDIFGEIES